MRTDDDNRPRTGNRRSLFAAGNLRLDIVTRLSADFVAVSPRTQSDSGKRIFDEIGGGIELCVMRHVALADLSPELLHIRPELFAQHNFIRRKQLRLRNILPGHSHSKPPE